MIGVRHCFFLQTRLDYERRNKNRKYFPEYLHRRSLEFIEVHMKIRVLFFYLLMVMLTLSRVGIGANQTPQEKFSDAVSLMESNKFAEAIPILDELKNSYPTETVYWNLGISSAEIGDNAKALQAWLAYRDVAPNDWRGRAKLVQANHALGNLEVRDRERAALVALWKAGGDAKFSEQPFFCREQFRHEGKKVTAFEYFNPTGSMMVVYFFL